MHIQAVASDEASRYRAVLMSDLSKLDQLALSDEERNYARSHLKNGAPLLINRYTSFLYLVWVNARPTEAQTAEAVRLAGNALVEPLRQVQAEKITIESSSSELRGVHLAEGLALGTYKFTKYFKEGKSKQHPLAEVLLAGGSEEEVRQLNASLAGTFLARNLVNEPLSYLTAERLAQEAQEAGKTHGLAVEVLSKKKIESLKMGGLLAVNRGSEDPPTFTILEHKPDNPVNEKPIVLVGKGVVYDTGGMSLKPTANSMDVMKSDMGGAAAALGAMVAAAKAELPLHLVALLPATDNRPGKNAYVPGDVITMYDGTTVEVLNTDAEGRLLLADALTYAQKYEPELVIDLATLTGNAAIAVGKYGVVGMGSAGEEAFEQMARAGERSYERLARLPFWEEYSELLESSIADLKNIGGREGGAITAGKFLEHFTDYPWIHLDIAGPAFLNSAHHYRPAGGTGVGVRLLFEFLKQKL
jgi:leucyl aminopeptidase